MSVEILNKVSEILYEDQYISDGYIKIQNKTGHILILYGAMYETPQVPFAKLKALSDYFKTNKISLNYNSQSGCETCDYGSDYCNEILVKESPMFDQIDWTQELEKKL